jgi:hypothetical protein
LFCTEENFEEKNSQKDFQKKVEKKFGSKIKRLYLCTEQLNKLILKLLNQKRL